MNKLSGIIKQVVCSPYMSLIMIEHKGDLFTAAVQEGPTKAAHFATVTELTFIFKETEVVLAKGLSGKISMRNRSLATIKSIETAGVLTRVAMDYKGQRLASVITTPSAEYLDLKPGDEVDWLVKANEIAIIGI